MVSLWPWRGDDASPASFERALSLLSNKISKHSAQLDALRQRSRRLKGLWTLYAGFAYILYIVVLALVLGWRNWAAKEYTAVAGGPVLIYIVRMLLRTYYDYRISVVTDRLEEVQREREKTIEKLKAATRYNTTQQLLEKYGGAGGGASTQSSPAGNSQKRISGRGGQEGAGEGQKRVNLIPPATANIPRNNGGGPLTSLPSTPEQRLLPSSPSPVSPLREEMLFPDDEQSVILDQQQQQPVQPGPPEFAPNAFSGPPQYVAVNDDPSRRSHWYDRLLDVLLGEDETLPKNRLALICSHCRLVNGQAPPGVKRLEDVGRWRCGGCAGWNGEQDEARKLVDDIKHQTRTETGVEEEEEEEEQSELGRSEEGLGDTSGEEEVVPVYND